MKSVRILKRILKEKKGEVDSEFSAETVMYLLLVSFAALVIIWIVFTMIKKKLGGG